MASTPTSVERLSFISFVGDMHCDAKTRTMIRSHVMKGKNLGKVLPGQKRRRRTKRIPHVPDQNKCNAESQSMNKSNSSRSTHVWQRPSVPKGLGSCSPPVQTAEELAPATLGLLLECQWLPATLLLGSETPSNLNVLSVCNRTKNTLFSLGSGLECDNSDADEGVWLQPLASDAAYLQFVSTDSVPSFGKLANEQSQHSTLAFSSETYYKWAEGCCDVDYTVSTHYSRTIRILRLRLTHGSMESKSSYTTIAVILALAVFAHLKGDVAIARDHLQGICGVVRLRGGIMSLRDKPKLLIQLLRCDLAMAMHNSVQPVLLRDILSTPQQFCKGPTRISHRRNFVPEDLNMDLVAAWRVLDQFSYAANNCNTVSNTLILETMVMTGYHLLSLKFDAATLDEIIRLTLLALTCSVFLSWDHVKILYSQLAILYEECVHNTMLSDGRVSDTMMVWILMAGQLCICRGESWLRNSIQIYITRAGITSRSELQAVLKSFVWIDALHDTPAWDLYESI